MTTKQMEAHRQGILAHARHLRKCGVPFENYRVGQVLDAALLLRQQGVPDWEDLHDDILTLYNERSTIRVTPPRSA